MKVGSSLLPIAYCLLISQKGRGFYLFLPFIAGAAAPVERSPKTFHLELIHHSINFIEKMG